MPRFASTCASESTKRSAGSALREFKAMKLEPGTLSQYVGVYLSEPPRTDTISFAMEGEHLVSRDRYGNQRVLAEAVDAFFTEDMEAWLTFTRDGKGRVDGMKLCREGLERWFNRLP
jgi:hypothetical protein